MLDPVRWSAPDGSVHSSWAPGVKLVPGKLRLLDQTKLPNSVEYLETDDLEAVFTAIRRLVVRGAPAIGCAAALGLAAAAGRFGVKGGPGFMELLDSAAQRLSESRPTAVNLFWALNRCVAKVRAAASQGVKDLEEALLKEALAILEEDISMCKSIGVHGSSLLQDGMGVLTHCNAGALATGDYGTALSPVYVAHEKGLKIKVFSDETRPLLQGSRLTAWELHRAGVDVTTICDNMAAQVMREGRVQIVIVGADRVAANGDAANKIGTYGVAILAKYHKIPFYVAIPYSTIDPSLPDGSLIPIEQRGAEEVSCGFGRRTAPEGVSVYNPAFDVTPHELVTGFITERGVLSPPFSGKMLHASSAPKGS